MGRHYSTKDFFRQIPNALLARYFLARGLGESSGLSVNSDFKGTTQHDENTQS